MNVNNFLIFQHLHEELPLELSALEYMLKSFPDVKEKEDMRKIIGRYGLTGREQVRCTPRHTVADLWSEVIR